METLTREQIIDRIQQLDKSEFYIATKDFLSDADRKALWKITDERRELEAYLKTLEETTA